MINDRERVVLKATEREARKVFRRSEAEKAMTEYETAQEAFTNNFERLKAGRLAREATTAVAKARTKKK